MKLKRFTFPRQAGFTLIEIIIVMVIIGILVTLAGGGYMTSQQKGRDARRKGDLKQIANALELYTNDHVVGTTFQYPDTTDPNLTTGTARLMGCGSSAVPSTCEWGNVFEQVGPNSAAPTLYMAKLPSDPKAPSANYQYLVDPTDQKWYVLFARLENTEDPGVVKINGNPTVYGNVSCGDLECNYAISSSNTTPTDHATLEEE